MKLEIPFQVYLSKKQHNRLQRLSAALKIPMSEVIRRALSEYSEASAEEALYE